MEAGKEITQPSAGEAPVNWIDIKLHSISNLPRSWYADAKDCGTAPLYSDHIFRYEVDVSIADVKATFKNGRLLQLIPLYAESVEAAKLPPAQAETHQDRPVDVPSDMPTPSQPPLTAASSARGGSTQSVVTGAGDRPLTERPASADATPALLWVLSTDTDHQEVKEEVDKKGASKKAGKAQAQQPPPTETRRPLPQPAPQPVSVVRLPVNIVQLAALEEAVELFKPLVLTFRRVLRPNCPAEWEDTQELKYQATISLSLKPLADPGSMQFTATVPLKPVVPENVKEDEKGKGKKTVQKKARGAVPAALLEELDLSEPHPYTSNQTCARISLSCHSAITRLPQARPRPDLVPADMIPKRLRPPPRPVESTVQYSNEVEVIVQKIAKAYKAHVEQKTAKGEEFTEEEARATFIELLQASGQSHAYKEVFIPSVQGIVKEKFLRKVNPSKQDLDRVSNELYLYLLDHMHLSMNRVFAKSVQPPPVSLDSSPAARWKRLAMEAEVMGEYALAARYHQERLVQFEDELPELWCEYAEFCLRVRDVLKAEQGYREGLSLDIANLPSLIGYGLLLLSRGRFNESEVFLQSAVDISPSSITWGCVALYFDMMLLQIQGSGDSEVKRTTCKRESKNAMTQAVRMNENPQCKVEDIYLLLAGHLLNLYQEDLASHCLSKLTPSAHVNFLYARLFSHTQQYDEAASILKGMIAEDPQHCDARMLLGEILFSIGNYADAELQYDAALRVNPQCGDGPAYIRLGNIYTSLGKFKDALGAFLMSAKIWPCGLTWLGVGISYYRLEDLLHAEQALNESNVYNNLNAKTWAYLALVCLRQKNREEEAQEAFNQAIKQGLTDSYLIAEVGAEQARLGRFTVAEACFRRSLDIHEDSNTRMHLARALTMMRRLPEAKEQFQMVAEQSTNETQRARALEQIHLMP